MQPPADKIEDAEFIDAPRDPDLVALHAYWLGKRGAGELPARADIAPEEMKALLPHVMLYDVGPAGRHRIRLVGSSIVEFMGRNLTGQESGTHLEARPAAAIRRLIDLAAGERRPVFRAGKAWWWREKSYRDFEACLLPLAPAGKPVNMVLAGVKFATRAASPRR
jgi:hypothetical protein